MGYPTKENSENSLLTQVRLNKSLSGVYQQFDASSGSRSLQRTTYQKRRNHDNLAADKYCEYNQDNQTKILPACTMNGLYYSPKMKPVRSNFQSSTLDSPSLLDGVNAKGITLENRHKALESLSTFLAQDKKMNNSCTSPMVKEPIHARLDIKVTKTSLFKTCEKSREPLEALEMMSFTNDGSSMWKYTPMGQTFDFDKIHSRREEPPIGDFQDLKNNDYSKSTLSKDHKHEEIRNLNFIRSVKEDARRRRVNYPNNKTDVAIETEKVIQNGTAFIRLKDFQFDS
ncbi:unnamed protein product [Moneuplotes crassus]|uniref:Uncharacterized protein n=1 Tax=Euplotes crassus TaxID=5936 RepID=A0AAD1X539_EUPCR|nr:unnamed protein product [Moneuplotes crassus]